MGVCDSVEGGDDFYSAEDEAAQAAADSVGGEEVLDETETQARKAKMLEIFKEVIGRERTKPKFDPSHPQAHFPQEEEEVHDEMVADERSPACAHLPKPAQIPGRAQLLLE